MLKDEELAKEQDRVYKEILDMLMKSKLTNGQAVMSIAWVLMAMDFESD